MHETMNPKIEGIEMDVGTRHFFSRVAVPILLLSSWLTPASAADTGPFGSSPSIRVSASAATVSGWIVADDFPQTDTSLYSPLFKPLAAVFLNCAKARRCGLVLLFEEAPRSSFFNEDFPMFDVVEWGERKVILRRDYPCMRDFWTLDGDSKSARLERHPKPAAEQKLSPGGTCPENPRIWRAHIGTFDEAVARLRRAR